MSCKNPYFDKKLGVLFSCGQCMPCRISRRRAWTCRAVLEMSQNATNTFLTITYNDDNQPLNGSLEPKHLTNFWKLLRKHIKFKYFACGEYGETTFRPHYHAILFGSDSFVVQNLSNKYWKYGFSYAVPATIETAQYVAGYVSKKLCNDNRDYQDLGLCKEFIRVSKGIGSGAIMQLARRFEQYPNIDIFDKIKIGDKQYPMPKYLKRKLREIFMSQDYRNALSESFVLNMRDELKDLVIKHFGTGSNFEVYAKDAYFKEHKQDFLNLESKEKIYLKRGKI